MKLETWSRYKAITRYDDIKIVIKWLSDTKVPPVMDDKFQNIVVIFGRSPWLNINLSRPEESKKRNYAALMPKL